MIWFDLIRDIGCTILFFHNIFILNESNAYYYDKKNAMCFPGFMNLDIPFTKLKGQKNPFCLHILKQYFSNNKYLQTLIKVREI